jgi:biotin carboxylase
MVPMTAHGTKPRVLLALPASSYRARAYAEAARELDIDLVLASDHPGAFGSLACPVHAVDFGDPRGSLARLRGELAPPVAGVLAADEKSALLAALLGADGALCRRPYHQPRGVSAAADKRLMRAELARSGVAIPGYRVLPAGHDAASLGEVAFPCVVKPAMLTGSQGVLRTDDGGELRRAIDRVRKLLERHPSALRRAPGFFDLLVEDYVDGPEVAVDGIMTPDGFELIAVFDKPDAMVGPTFEETLLVTPSRKPPALVTSIVATAVEAARALGLDCGPIHAELRLAGDRPVLIEVAARSIGGLCSRALEPLVGSLEERLLRAALGLDVSPQTATAAPAPASGVLMIPVPRSGVLRAVHGVAEARAWPGVSHVEVTAAAGEALRVLPEGDRYLGFVFAVGADAAEVEASLRGAHAALRIDLSPLLGLV